MKLLTTTMTRRGLIASSAGVALAAGMHRQALAQATPEVATPVPGVWPRTVTGSLGDTTIPAQPVRVAATSDWYEVDYLMAMGISPVMYGYTNRYGLGVSPWLTALGGDTLPRYDLTEAIDVEAILATTPDLILADPFLAAEVYDVLQQVAPTVALPTPYTGSTDWREGQIVAGQACGTEDAAARAIADTEAVIAAGTETLTPYADRSVTIAYASEYNGGSLFFSGADSQEATIVRQLGLNWLPGFDDNTPQSLETLNRLNDADLVLSYDLTGSLQILEGTELFATLEPVRAGRFVVLSGPTARVVRSVDLERSPCDGRVGPGNHHRCRREGNHWVELVLGELLLERTTMPPVVKNDASASLREILHCVQEEGLG